MNPQDIQEIQEPPCQRKIINDRCVADDCRGAYRAHHQHTTAAATKPPTPLTIEKATTEISTTIHEPVVVVPTSLLPELSTPSHDLLSFNFDNIDTQRAIDSYSTKSSVKNSSSGILEVLQDLEAEEERENERKRNQVKASSTTTQSNQDLSTYKPKEESKRFAFRSLLKRTHSAPKKIQLTKGERQDIDPDQPQSPTQVQCCHPIVEKLKTMADKHVNKNKDKDAATPKKSKSKSLTTTTIKTVPLQSEKKIVLAEQTRIIRLKDSPKAERKNVAAYLEKRDSDDIVEIVQLDESPSETRKRREEIRKLDEQNDDKKTDTKKLAGNDDSEKEFVVPQNLTGLNTEPTVEELLEEEFKNDPPKKAPRKVKEHIYEEIDTPGAITSHVSAKLGKPANVFACAVLHSVLNKDEFKEKLKRQNEIEDDEEERLAQEKEASSAAVVTIETSELSTLTAPNDETKPIPDEIIEIKTTVNEPNDTLQSNCGTDETNEKDQSQNEVLPKNDNDSENREKTDNDESNENAPKSDNDQRKDGHVKEEKKVKFSQSTEEYQDKLAAEKAPEKEDVELPENIKVSKRWSNMRSVC